MNKPTGNCIEVGYSRDGYREVAYRYYGYAHMQNAKCLGEGDWRIAIDGKESPTNGIYVPAEVLKIVGDECEKQEKQFNPNSVA